MAGRTRICPSPRPLPRLLPLPRRPKGCDVVQTAPWPSSPSSRAAAAPPLRPHRRRRPLLLLLRSLLLRSFPPLATAFARCSTLSPSATTRTRTLPSGRGRSLLAHEPWRSSAAAWPRPRACSPMIGAPARCSRRRRRWRQQRAAACGGRGRCRWRRRHCPYRGSRRHLETGSARARCWQLWVSAASKKRKKQRA